MPNLTRTQLNKHIKTGDFSNVYFFYGEDKYSVKKLSCNLAKTICKNNISDFDFYEADGDTLDMNFISNFANTFPIGSDHKCIIIKNLDLESFDKNAKDEFFIFLDHLSPNCILIISQNTVEFNPKKSSIYKKLIKAIDKKGFNINLDYMSRFEIRKHIVSYAHENGNAISDKNADILLEFCSMDMNGIYNELDKLCAYKLNQEIKFEDIDKLCTKSLQSSVFILAKSVMQGKTQKALLETSALIMNKESPIAIIAVLSSVYIDIYRAKLSQELYIDANRMINSFAEDYKGREFKFKNALRDSHIFSDTQIKSCINLLMEADYNFKNSPVDNNIILQELIVKLSNIRTL